MIVFHSSNGTLIDRTFHLLPHENICTIALINIHYLCNIHEVKDWIVPFHEPGGRVKWPIHPSPRLKAQVALESINMHKTLMENWKVFCILLY